MITLTDLDLRLADHTARVARIDRAGWQAEAAPSTRGRRTRWTATAVGLVRRHVGVALVRAGARLQGLPAGHVVNSAAS